MSLTQAQLEQRLDYITGSDAAVILGLSQWKNKIELWQEKTRQRPLEYREPTQQQKWGTIVESSIAEFFAQETGKQIEVDDNFIISAKQPFMAANIDRRIVGENAGLECKSAAHAHGWGEQGDNTIPLAYLCQVVHYAITLDTDRYYTAVTIMGRDFRHYTYERNAAFEKFLIEKEEEFWHHVQTETPPPATTHDEIISLYKTMESEPVIATHTVDLAIDNLKLCVAEEKRIEELKAEYQNIIKAHMQNHEVLVGLDGKIAATWKLSKPSKRFNAKQFQRAHKELYESYSDEQPGSRRFLIK